MNSIKETRSVAEYTLIVSSVLLIFPCVGALFGLYWLTFGGRFSYEGWYFIAFAVLLSVLAIPSAIYFYIWPKPKFNNQLRAVCSLPFIIMLLFGLSLAWSQIGN